MVARILTTAVLAGAGAGLIAALLQLAFVQPVLLQAELYERGALTHFGTATPAATSSAPTGPGGFQPLRDGLSVIFAMLVYCGYALIAVALMALAEARGARIDARTGLVWGLAGFVAVYLAPGFGLPPEVPGVAAADLQARQIWWAGTAAASAAALWLIAFGRTWAAWGAAVVLLLVPHLIGAPQPAAPSGPVPPEIAALFAARALGVGMAAWVVLGGFAGRIWAGDAQRAAQPTVA